MSLSNLENGQLSVNKILAKILHCITNFWENLGTHTVYMHV